MCVLRRLAGLDMSQFNLPLERPGQEMTTGQLWPVVTANRQRPAAHGDDFIQHSRHAPAGKAGVHFQRQALPRKNVDYAQHANVATGGKYIMSEIQGPFLVGGTQFRPRRSDAHTVPALLPLQAQPSFAILPPHSLMVHSLALALQQHLQSPIAVTWLLSGQPYQPFPQRLVRSPRSIPVTRHRNRHQPAYPAFAGSILRSQPASSRPSVYELRPFFAITAFNISRSRLRSATRRLSREFSSSSDRNRCASL